MATFTPTFTPGGEIFFISHNVFTPGSPVSITVAGQYSGNYSLRVYNSAGEHILSFPLGEQPGPLPATTYLWDGTNKNGEKCATGVYIIYLMEPMQRRLGRVVLIN
jgi:flagellar hook assembly protein FlgD